MFAHETQEAGRTWPVADNFMPDFRLPSAEGQPVETACYRGRSIILVFAGDYDSAASMSLPAELARRRTEVARESAEVLVVVRGTPA
jgi:peroxiredoxin